MAVRTPIYKKVDSSDETPELDEEPNRHKSSLKWPRASTIVLSIMTFIFGFHSLYLSLLPRDTCPLHTSEDGYSTDWSNLWLPHLNVLCADDSTLQPQQRPLSSSRKSIIRVPSDTTKPQRHISAISTRQSENTSEHQRKKSMMHGENCWPVGTSS